jgi:hypothetical protein
MTAIKLDRLMTIDIDDVEDTRYKHRGNSNPKYSEYLRVWGVANIVKLTSHKKYKVDGCGHIYMSVANIFCNFFFYSIDI